MSIDFSPFLGNFYPRPPRGGRHQALHPQAQLQQGFLSTSPAWGTTLPAGRRRFFVPNFYPRPPRGGRLSVTDYEKVLATISIHVPRVGDDVQRVQLTPHAINISIHVPRVGDDTGVQVGQLTYTISIHVPRVGDDGERTRRPAGGRKISIHVPRVGDDRTTSVTMVTMPNFYPRPPRGGRPGDKTTAFASPTDFYPRPPRGGRPEIDFCSPLTV